MEINEKGSVDDYFQSFTDIFRNLYWISSKKINNWNYPKSIYADIAAKIQNETEKAILYLAKNAYKLAPSKNLCIAGWVGLNILANSRILKETPFENVFVQPAANDSGLSLWATYYAYHVLWKHQKRIPIYSYGLWKQYSDEEILISLKKYDNKIVYTKSKNIFKESAKLLSDNNIIAFFQWRSEYWPRALWFRSILASPKNIIMRDKVNDIKKRERWRPLSPIIIEEELENYIWTNIISPFMTFAEKVKNKCFERAPAIIHNNGTARYQTVNTTQNKYVYELLLEFKKYSWIPILINTSLNLKWEPIVETPEDALIFFLKTKTDYLIVWDYLVKK